MFGLIFNLLEQQIKKQLERIIPKKEKISA
jgi:hypothetical protein